MSPELRHRVAVRAASQAGVLTPADLAGLGCTRTDVRTALRRGTWTQLCHGVIAPLPAPQDPQLAALQLAAGVLLRHEPTPASPRDARLVGALNVAARVLELPLVGRVSPGVTLSDRWPAPRTDVRCAEVPDRQVVLAHGVAVTSPARTAVDLGRAYGLLKGVIAADVALRRGTRPDQLHDAATTCKGWRGAPVGRQVASLARDDSESPLESVGRTRIALAGLPVPKGQVTLVHRGRFLGRVDHLWEDLRLVGEADGKGKYADIEDVHAEKDRHEGIVDAGYDVFRYGWVEAWTHPDWLLAKVRAALAKAERAHRRAA